MLSEAIKDEKNMQQPVRTELNYYQIMQENLNNEFLGLSHQYDVDSISHINCQSN